MRQAPSSFLPSFLLFINPRFPVQWKCQTVGHVEEVSMIVGEDQLAKSYFEEDSSRFPPLK